MKTNNNCENRDIFKKKSEERKYNRNTESTK